MLARIKLDLYSNFRHTPQLRELLHVGVSTECLIDQAIKFYNYNYQLWYTFTSADKDQRLLAWLTHTDIGQRIRDNLLICVDGIPDNISSERARAELWHFAFSVFKAILTDICSVCLQALYGKAIIKFVVGQQYESITAELGTIGDYTYAQVPQRNYRRHY